MERKKVLKGAAYQQESCADYIVRLFSADDYQVQKLRFDDEGTTGTLVQVKNTTSGFWSTAKKWTGLEVCAMLKLVQQGDDLELSVEAGKWLDKAALAAFGMFVAVGGLAITSAIGAVKQKKLLDKVFIDALGFFSGAK